jgi:hypothetical protein
LRPRDEAERKGRMLTCSRTGDMDLQTSKGAEMIVILLLLLPATLERSLLRRAVSDLEKGILEHGEL